MFRAGGNLEQTSTKKSRKEREAGKGKECKRRFKTRQLSSSLRRSGPRQQAWRSTRQDEQNQRDTPGKPNTNSSKLGGPLSKTNKTKATHPPLAPHKKPFKLSAKPFTREASSGVEQLEPDGKTGYLSWLLQHSMESKWRLPVGEGGFCWEHGVVVAFEVHPHGQSWRRKWCLNYQRVSGEMAITHANGPFCKRKGERGFYFWRHTHLRITFCFHNFFNKIECFSHRKKERFFFNSTTQKNNGYINSPAFFFLFLFWSVVWYQFQIIAIKVWQITEVETWKLTGSRWPSRPSRSRAGVAWMGSC